MIKAFLFDLDGTLLPMDQDVFVKYYFGMLAKKMIPYGYDPDQLVKAIWKGTSVMVNNDGLKTNEEVFWDFFVSLYGEEKRQDEKIFAEFYEKDFNNVKVSCGFQPLAAEVVKKVKEKGFRAILATNPIFPSIATESRIRWAGLNQEDFEFFTSYENSHFSKPNKKYYEEVLSKANLNPEECIMIGNDVAEDMVAAELGMKVFLVTDCMINKNDVDVSAYPRGSMEELLNFIDTI